MVEEPPLQESPTMQSFDAKSMWHKAVKLLRSRPDSSDPWFHFDLSIETQYGIRYRYSAIKKKWIQDNVEVKIEAESFDRGAMRKCYRLKKLSVDGKWIHASNYVAKHYVDKVDRSVYFEDVRLQMEAKLWGEAYNRLNPPKKIDIFQLSVIEIQRGDEKVLYHIERFMEGDYCKYNSNSGFVDENARNTPQAFSHFTFERSGHRLMVVDIQGVGDLYTDPQIHTSDGVGYSDGNLGMRGMALFFNTHRCNPICKWLCLAPFDLSENELLQDHPTLLKVDNKLTISAAEADREESFYDVDDVPSSIADDISACLDLTDKEFGARRNSIDNSINQSPLTNGRPIVSRRRRTVSYSHSSPTPNRSFEITKTLPDGSIESFQRVFGATVKRSSEESLLSLTPGITARRKNDSWSSNTGIHFDIKSPTLTHEQRNRANSGDSGISGNPLIPVSNVNGKSVSFDLPATKLLSPFIDQQNPTSPIVFPKIGRRIRTISESSDVDAEDHQSFFGNNFPHQMMMHETQKPACTDHPTNLDQEIGQSILGQIHHELARLHEAGRFIKQKDNSGWSCGIIDANESDSSDSTSNTVSKIDWSSVLFHEKNASQLGCLEAMIVMAHYYLGLPTTLLYDCPLKASLDEVGMGMEYLWRSAEGGDRRCMILLGRYLDTYATGKMEMLIKDERLRSFLTTPKDLIVLPRVAEAIEKSNKLDGLLLGVSSLPAQKPWLEAISWYRKAVDTAAHESTIDEGFDAEGRYDSASDLLTVYLLLARMAEMYLVGGYGIQQDFSKAGDLFNEAAESAMSTQQGQLAMKYFELSEEAYALCQDDNETAD